MCINCGCATTGAPDPADPLQPMNRGIYRFNDSLDRAALRPVASGTASPSRFSVKLPLS